jgi:hypothetical protein
MKDIGSDILLDCNDDFFINSKPFAQKFNKEYGACGLKVSDGLIVTLPIDVCHGDIRESMIVLDVL